MPFASFDLVVEGRSALSPLCAAGLPGGNNFLNILIAFAKVFAQEQITLAYFNCVQSPFHVVHLYN